MKRMLVLVLMLVMVGVLVGCQEQRDAKVPIEDPDYIIVYNGGEVIYEAYSEDGEITVAADKFRTVTVSIGDTSEYWLVYYFTQNGITTKIVDSDTLSIVWQD